MSNIEQLRQEFIKDCTKWKINGDGPCGIRHVDMGVDQLWQWIVDNCLSQTEPSEQKQEITDNEILTFINTHKIKGDMFNVIRTEREVSLIIDMANWIKEKTNQSIINNKTEEISFKEALAKQYDDDRGNLYNVAFIRGALWAKEFFEKQNKTTNQWTK